MSVTTSDRSPAQLDVTQSTGLLARLGTIEQQPLSERAVSYVQLHDEMRDQLEGGDAPPTPRAD